MIMKSDFLKDLPGICREKIFSLQEVIKKPIDSKHVFIIANERLKKNNEVGRYYTIFPNMKIFLQFRNFFPHCHEILVDHQNNKPNTYGRLVFDFDLKKDKMENLPNDFKESVEETIMEVINNYFHDVDINLLQFVWSTSKNPHKFSKHLTVKNLCFDNWLSMSRIFYKLFCLEWDKHYTWIHSSKLIDSQIIRIKASLRMVGSSKINGYPLELDDPRYTLQDSLIRIYFKQQKECEQIVTINHLNENVIERVLDEPKEKVNKYYVNCYQSYQDISYPKKIYKLAFSLFQKKRKFHFRMGKMNGEKLILLRTKAAKCLVSKETHERQNSFLRIKEEGKEYNVYFGCYQQRCRSKSIFIGSIDKKTLETRYYQRQKITF
jgi:hypothetical protein